MNNVKYILLILFAILLMALAGYTGYKYNSSSIHRETSASVVLEKVQKVFKLVTVEGHFAEIYKVKEHDRWELSLFRKKALLRVNAKVAVGYDFEKITITVDEATKTVYFEDFPDPEILSLEHDLDYYDITQGTFNQFTADDYNRINNEAKNFIRKKAMDSDLLASAESQKGEIMDMLKTILEATGWNVVVGQKQDTLIG